MIGGVVGAILGLLQGAGYPGIFAIVGLESAGLPLPGETTLLAASYLAATGSLWLPLVIASAALGAILGDSLGYLVGRKGGRRFFERYGRYVGITEKKLRKADRYFERHGAKTVFFGRFVAVLRVLAGPLAGASRMPYRRFLAANAAGGITWATLMGTLGFFFGKPVAAFLSALGLWALGLVALYIVLHLALRHRAGILRWISGKPRTPRISLPPDDLPPEPAEPVAECAAAGETTRSR